MAKTGQKRVEDILIKRDGITREEAQDLIEHCREDLYDGNWEAIQDWLGLEDDYIYDIV